MVNISSGDVAPKDVVTSLMGALEIGREGYNKFLARFEKTPKKSIHDKISLNKLKSFKHLYKTGTASKNSEKISELKESGAMYAKLFALSQSGRIVDTEKTMQTEHSLYPQALADRSGNLSTPRNKSALTSLLMDDIDCDTIPQKDGTVAIVVDGMAFIRSSGKPQNATTFGDIAQTMKSSLITVCKKYGSQRLDLVFDRYRTDSVKSGTRSQRGAGKIKNAVRRQITGRDTKLPKDLDSFFTIGANKADLERFLAEEFTTWQNQFPGIELIIAGGFENPTTASSSIGRDLSCLESDQEEADSRIILHCTELAGHDYDRVIILSIDTDVLVMLLHHHGRMPAEVWMQHGRRSDGVFIPVHEIAERTDDAILKNLPAYHAVTGCDTTSGLRYHSKVSSWKAYSTNHTLLDGLGLGLAPSPETKAAVEEFVVSLYNDKLPRSQRTDCTTADAMRTHMLLKLKNTDRQPPTTENLQLHILR